MDHLRDDWGLHPSTTQHLALNLPPDDAIIWVDRSECAALGYGGPISDCLWVKGERVLESLPPKQAACTRGPSRLFITSDEGTPVASNRPAAVRFNQRRLPARALSWDRTPGMRDPITGVLSAVCST